MLKLDNLITRLHSFFSYKFVDQLQHNFEEIKLWADSSNKALNDHKKQKNDAHTSDQIKHVTKKGQDVSLSDELNYQNEKVTNLVLGHNGNGIQELRA
ncbi:peptidase G2, partial [Streptococcus equi]|nr:peptidase G2 [Streptococcus equi]